MTAETFTLIVVGFEAVSLSSKIEIFERNYNCYRYIYRASVSHVSKCFISFDEQEKRSLWGALIALG